jgi:hypothetical protein
MDPAAPDYSIPVGYIEVEVGQRLFLCTLAVLLRVPVGVLAPLGTRRPASKQMRMFRYLTWRL